jgi:hypothetical protein
MNQALTRPRQGGVAALSVVMVLFFIMAMVAAYTNRNLVFEQRTSANSYRSARSLSAADAAVDWTIAMLNGGTIGTACTDKDLDVTDDFKTRYLNLDPDGKFRPKLWPTPTIFVGTDLAGKSSSTFQTQPSCSGVEGGGLSCSCPITEPPALLNAANSEQPVFTVAFEETDPRVGLVNLKVRACNSIRSGKVTASNVNAYGSCHVNDLQPSITQKHKNYVQVDSMTMLSTTLGLVSALPVPPAASLTAAGSIDQTAGTLTAVNADPLTGVALHAGGSISSPSTVKAAGPAGSTAKVTAAGDTDLSSIPTSDFFRKALGLPPDKYGEQPASVKVACGGGCAANTAVVPKLSKGPTRVIFIDGDLDLNSATAIGSDATPAMLVVSGNVTVSASIALKGVLFVGGDLKWTAPAGTVTGAVIVGGNYSGTGNATISYDREAVRKIHKGYGSFVRVPGTWNLEMQ